MLIKLQEPYPEDVEVQETVAPSGKNVLRALRCLGVPELGQVEGLSQGFGVRERAENRVAGKMFSVS